MSEQSVVALIAVIASAAVGVASLGFNFWNSSRERGLRVTELRLKLQEREDDYREWYRHTLFDKRLAALQTEYAWLMKLNRLRANVDDTKQESIDELNEAIRGARDWYDLNAMFLYDVPPNSSDFIGAVNSASEPRSGSNFFRQLNDALNSHRRRAKNLMNLQNEAGSNAP